MTTETLTRSERGMIEFMELNHNKKSRIMSLLESGSSEINKYFDNPTKENIDYLFQKETHKRAYEEFIDIIKYFSVEELTILYISHMSNKHTFGYGVFTFVSELRSVLRKEPKRAAKEIKTKNIEKDEVVEVVEERQVSKVSKNEVGLFTDMFEGHKVRVLGTPENPLFVLRDVCNALGLSNPKVVKSRLQEGVSSTYPLKTSGGTQQVVVINEDGLYDVVMDSRKPEAKRFRKWVTGDVLPSIRKHGGYLTPDKIEDVLTDPDLLIGLATALKEERQRVKDAELLIEQAKPKVEYHDQVLKSKYMITTTEIAKSLGIGATQLNDLLSQKGLIYKNGKSWVPYKEFEWLVDEKYIVFHVGFKWGQHLKWTERGRKLIHKIVKEDLNKYQIKSLRNIEE